MTVLARLVGAAPIEALPAVAALHRLGGAVSGSLDGVEGVPDHVAAQLDALRQRASLHNLLITGTLDEIKRRFDEGSVRWVVMKGPVVARLYPQMGDRSYADLDLLVDRRDYPTAMQILESIGLQHVIRNWALAEEMLAGQVEMVGRGVRVDLHWHLHYAHEDRTFYKIDPEAMIERRRTVTVSGVQAPTLDPTDTVIKLAFHAARSDGHRLMWFKDIERAVSVDRPDFDELIERCCAYRCAPPVGLMLERARTMLDAPIPSEVIRELTPPSLSVANRLVAAVVDPVQFDERPTITRAFTRSVRSSAMASITAVPARALRTLRRRVSPPAENETDDPNEKASYLDAVVSTTQN